MWTLSLIVQRCSEWTTTAVSKPPRPIAEENGEPCAREPAREVESKTMPEIESKTIIRYGFKMDDANWKDLKRDLKNMNWDELKHGTAEDALDFFMDHLWLLLCTHIPYQEIVFHKKSHPWLNAKCKEAIEKKNAAEDSPEFQALQKECRQVLTEEYQTYLRNLKEKIAKLPKGSKQR